MRLGAAHGEHTSVMIWLTSRARGGGKDLIRAGASATATTLRASGHDGAGCGGRATVPSSGWHDLRGPAGGIQGSRDMGRSLRMDDEARDTIQRFHDALNSRDLDALGDLITDDC